MKQKFQQFLDAVQPIYSGSEYTKYSEIINRVKKCKIVKNKINT